MEYSKGDKVIINKKRYKYYIKQRTSIYPAEQAIMNHIKKGNQILTILSKCTYSNRIEVMNQDRSFPDGIVLPKDFVMKPKNNIKKL